MLAGAAVLVAASIGAVVGTSAGKRGTPAAPAQPANTVAVVRGTLSATVSLQGTLTRRARPDGSPYAVINQARGTYTELPDDGAERHCGDVLYRVDDDPVLLLCGPVPAYRDVRRDDVGEDVRQLNQNLHALGYVGGLGLGLDPGDDVFTWTTEGALEALQHDKGFEVTGALALDEAVYLPESVRVAKVTGDLGGPAQPGARVLEATSDTPEVQVDLAPSQQGAVKQGDPARVTLPGNRSLTGTVVRFGRVARVSAGPDGRTGSPTIPAYIALDEPDSARDLDQAPVEVEIGTAGVERALSVPVTAIVGRSGGGFAVEVVRTKGARQLIAVDLGLFDSTAGRVQVLGEGALREGDHVIVPSS
jgi:hypothetical protein